MAEKKYLDDVGLDEVAQHVNRRLKVVDVMPVSANNGAVRLYSGADDDPFLQGHIYKYENNAWVDITGTAEATEVIVNVETLPTGEDIEDVFYRVTSTGKLYKGDSTNQTTTLVTPDFDSNDFDVDNNTVALSAAQRIFTGTQTEWEALSTAVKKTYGQVNITDDESDPCVVVDAVTDGDMHAVTSNAVFDAFNSVIDLTNTIEFENNITPQASFSAWRYGKMVEIALVITTSTQLE